MVTRDASGPSDGGTSDQERGREVITRDVSGPSVGGTSGQERGRGRWLHGTPLVLQSAAHLNRAEREGGGYTGRTNTFMAQGPGRAVMKLFVTKMVKSLGNVVKLTRRDNICKRQQNMAQQNARSQFRSELVFVDMHVCTCFI